MCDCFHVVLPTWPGAPGSESGRQLQVEEPGAGTEEDHSGTGAPVENIRPRPQGSSPVYECTAEGAGFGVQEDTPGRRGSSGRRRSWWKRDSRVFSRMSHSEAVQEAAEVTLETEVEAGASGYSVTGGGDQGIFVKQVLKDSSAAKLFSLREGDQLLSATIFFDGIKYEDALKILQYSEPYKIQFKIKRKLPATVGEELAVCGPQLGSTGKEQDKEAADEGTATPTKMPETDGDRERLISKPRESRGRRPRERLSWPKFQAIKSKRRPGPRRSHSSSEASERGDAPDMSPTSTDTEAPLPEELQDQRAGLGHQRRRRFLNLRFKMGSGQGPSATGHRGREAQGRPGPAEVLGELGPWDNGPEDTGAAAGGSSKVRAQAKEATGELPVQEHMEPRLPGLVLADRAPGEGAGKAVEGQRKTQRARTQHKEGKQGKSEPGPDAGLSRSWKEQWAGAQSLETSTTRLSLQAANDAGSTQTPPPDTQVRIRILKTPTFGFSKEKVLGTEIYDKGLEERGREHTSPAGEGGETSETTPTAHGPGTEGDTDERQKTLQGMQEAQEDKDMERREVKMKMPKFKMPSFGWSPTREPADTRPTPARGKEQEEDVTVEPHGMITDKEEMLMQKEGLQTGIKSKKEKDTMTMERDMKKEDKDAAAKDSKFKRPKFKMPSFGVSGPSKAVEASESPSAPKVEADVGLSSIQGDHRNTDVSVHVLAADMESRDGQVEMTLLEGSLPEGEVSVEATTGASLKGHLPKVQVPSFKIPKVDLKSSQVDLKGPQVDMKGPKSDVIAPNLDVVLPSVKVDVQEPGVKVEGNLALGHKDMATKDSKFKMPKFKMPSFGVSGPSKDMEASVELSKPKVVADVGLPSIQGNLKNTDLNIQVPVTDLEARPSQVGVTLPEGKLPVDVEAGAALKGHLLKAKMPSIKMSKVDLKGPQVDLKGPKGKVSTPDLEVNLPVVKLDIQTPGTKLEGDLAQGDKDTGKKDNKFKMPKFKMSSLGVSGPSKDVEASVELSMPKVEANMCLPSIQGDLKSTDLNIQDPATDIEARAGHMGVTLSEGLLSEREVSVEPTVGAGLKGYLPKVQMSTIKMPKVDLKGPQMDLKCPQVDLKGPKSSMITPDLDVALPGLKADIQAMATKVDGDLALGGKDAATKDSKFKMPKFKMPSFGVSGPSKAVEASVELSMPKVEADVGLPSVQGDLKSTDFSIQVPAADLEARASQVGVTFCEGELPVAVETGPGLKGHLPKVQMPSIKMPTVDLKGPQGDVKGPKGDLIATEMEVTLPGMQVDIQAPGAKLEGDLALGVEDGVTKNSKFKMPKFKMPYIGVSEPSKDVEASVELSMPRVEADVGLPSIQGDLKSTDLNIQVPVTDLEARTDLVGMTLPEGSLPEGKVSAEATAGVSLKGHLPKVQMPSIKMPKVDLKRSKVDLKGSKVDVKGSKVDLHGPQMDLKSTKVDLKGPILDINGPQVDVKGPQSDMITPDLDVALPSVKMDIQTPGIKVDGNLALGDKDAATKDSKFKMPKFKMPSFGMSGPSKDVEASMELSMPKVEADMGLPSIQGDLKSTDLNIQVPAADLEARANQVGMILPEGSLPEGKVSAEATAAADLKGHLPKVQMPSIKMPKVDLKGSKVDVKGSKVDLHGPQMDLKSTKEDLKGPILDIKGPQVDVKGPQSDKITPDLDVALPSMKVDMQTPGIKVDGNLALGDKDAATKDSKFKMPKFKMPSFGMLGPGKAVEASMELSMPKVETDVGLPSIQGDFKSPGLIVQVPVTDLETRPSQVGVALCEGELPVAVEAGPGLKGHLAKIEMPSIKMPKVDLKEPHVDIKGPKIDLKGPKLDIKDSQVEVKGPNGEATAPDLEVTLPCLQVGIRSPGAKLEDLALGVEDAETKDSKFKMPKFKMSSFGMSDPGKAVEASVELSTPKLEADVGLPSIQGDLKSTDLNIQVPAADLEARANQVGMILPEGSLPEGKVSAEATAAAGLYLGQMPSIKMPKVDLKDSKVDLKGSKVDLQGPQMDLKSTKVDLKGTLLDIKGPQVDVKGPQSDMITPDLDVALPSVKVDMQTPGIKVDGNLALGDKDAATKDSKLKMPKFKMPSFGMSGPSKDLEASVELSMPRVEADVGLPSIQGDLKSTDLNIQVPAADLEARANQVGMILPEGSLPEGKVSAEATAGVSLKGHLPKVQMPSIKMPKVDLKGSKVDLKGSKVDVKGSKVDLHGPQMDLKSTKVDLKGPILDINGPQVDVKGPQSDMITPDLDVALPSVKMDIQTPGIKVDGNLALGDKDAATKDSKFKMPKFKMPSFGMSGPSKDVEASMELSMPKVEADVGLPSIQGDLKSTDLNIQVPAADLEARANQVGMILPEGSLPEGKVSAEATAGVSLKEHLAKIQMPSIKMPKEDLKGPQVDMKGPKSDVIASDLDVALSSEKGEKVDIQIPGVKLEEDGALGNKDLATKDSKFKIPKFKLPSFGMSGPDKAVEDSVELSTSTVEADVGVPSIQGDFKSTDLSIQILAAEMDARASQAGLMVPEGSLPKGVLPAEFEAGASLKGHLPKVQVPSIKLPKVDLKGPQLDLKGPQVDLKGSTVDVKNPSVDLQGPQVDVKGPEGEVSAPDLEVTPPSVQVDIQAPGAKLEGNLALGVEDAATKDSKFKMPKFKMPSFGMSGPSKDVEASVELSTPTVEADVGLPSIQGDLKSTDLSIQVPAANIEARDGQVCMTLPEGSLPEGAVPAEVEAGAGLKGHLPKVQVPSIKIPKVDLKSPQVDLKGPKVDVKGPKVDLKGSSVDMKGPKGEVSAPNLEVTLPGVQVDIQAPSAKLEGDLALGHKDAATKDSKFKMPKFKMLSLGVSGPRKDVEASVELSMPKVEADVGLPSIQGDLKSTDFSIQVPAADLDARAGLVGATLPEDLLPEGEEPTTPSAGAGLTVHLPKVHMPIIKMPSVDLKGPKVDLKSPQVDLKGLQMDIKGPKDEVSVPHLEVTLPSVQVDIQAPGAKLEGDLALGDKEVATKDSKFKMPQFKMPYFGVSGPSKDVEASVELSTPTVEANVGLASIQGYLKSTDLSSKFPADDLGARDGQVCATLLEGSLPKGEVTAEVETRASLKGHLPKVEVPSIKMSKVDLKCPKVDFSISQVDLKDPKLDLKDPQVDMKGPQAAVSISQLEMTLPSVKDDVQALGTKVGGDLALGATEVARKDSKFKMPKFKMPSLGVSGPSKAAEASVELSTPTVEADVRLPSIQGDLKSTDLSIQVPAANMEARDGQVCMTLPEGSLPEGAVRAEVEAGAGIKGHLPKVQVPSIKMPKVDLKCPKVDFSVPQVDLKDPKLDLKDPQVDMKGPQAAVRTSELEMTLPSVKDDVQALGTKVGGDLALGATEVARKDSKFKMPKFKMPSLGVSGPSKAAEASVELSMPTVEADVGLPSIQGDLKSTDLSIQVPAANMEARDGQVCMTLPEGSLPEGAVPAEVEAGAGLKGHLPKVQLPSIKIPKVDLKSPQVDLKGPKVDVKGPKVDLKGSSVDMKGPKGEVSAPNLEVTLPGVQVDIQAPSAKLEGDLALGHKDAAPKDSKFKMPKFKMLSLGVSGPSKNMEASVELSMPKVEADVGLPSIQGDLKSTDLSIKFPAADLGAKAGEVCVTLPEGSLPEGEVTAEFEAGAGPKGHLPKVQVPSIKMPKVDLKCPKVDFSVPQVDLKDSKLDLKDPQVDMKGPQAAVSTSELEVTLPSVKDDIQALGTKVGGVLALGSTEVARKDSKFKMSKFKLPSLGVSGPSKAAEASVELSMPTVEADVGLPSIQGDFKSTDLSIQVPAASMEARDGQVCMTLPEGSLPEGAVPAEVEAGAGLKGHLPKVQVPSIKIPKVDLKSPQVDLKGPKVDLKGSSVDMKGPKGEVSAPNLEVTLPGVQVDIQAPSAKLEGDLALGHKDAAPKDSKFKMPKFKMLSLGVSGPSKNMEASVELSMPKVEADVGLPSIQGDLKSTDLSIKFPAADLGAKAGEVCVTLPEGSLPEGEVTAEVEAGAGLKGHLPKVQVPSIKMSKVDLKCPKVDFSICQVDLKDPKLDLKDPQVDMKGPQAAVSTSELEVTLSSVKDDVQALGTKVGGVLALGSTEVARKDSKFKMPKFKMPSLGVSGPSKAAEASVELSMPTVEADVRLPSIQGDLKSTDFSIQVPAADLDARAGLVGATLPEDLLPEGEEPTTPSAGAGLTVHLPKVHMPIIKMPSVDLKGPKVDLKSPQVDLKGLQMDIKGPKDEVSVPHLEVTLPSVQAPGAKLEGDLALRDKEVATKDSKFKMPKFKMPFFGMSGPSKDVEASVELSTPTVEADIGLASVQGDLKSTDLSIQLPTSDLKARAGQVGVTLPAGTLPKGEEPTTTSAGASQKGHLPKVQISSTKMPKVDFKVPKGYLKGPQMDVKGSNGEVIIPEQEVTLPSMQVDIQVPGSQLQGDLALGYKDAAARESKFQMADVDISTESSEVESPFWRPHFKISKFFHPHRKSPKDIAGMAESSGAVLLRVDSASSQHSGVECQEPSLSIGPGFVTYDPTTDNARCSAFPSGGDPTLRAQPGPSMLPCSDLEGPQMPSLRPEADVPSPGIQTSVGPAAGEVVPMCTPDGQPGPEDPLIPAFHAHVAFPKFHKPKFGFPIALPEADTCVSEKGTDSSLLCPVEGLNLSGEGMQVGGLPAPQPLSTGVPAFPMMEEHEGQFLLATPAEDEEHEEKGSPFKMPRLKLPSLSRSPKKGAVMPGDPGYSPEDSMLSLVLETDQVHTQPGVHISQTKMHVDVPPEKDGEKGRLKKSGFAMPKLALPKRKASKGQQASDPAGALDASSTTGRSDPKVAELASNDGIGGDTGLKAGSLVGDGGDLQLPQVPVPCLGFADLNLGAFTDPVEVNLSKGDLCLPKHDLAVRGGGKEGGLGDDPVIQSHRERTAPTAQPEYVPTMESPEEGTEARETRADSQERWFKMPKFRVPGFRRSSSKEPRGSLEQETAEMHMQAASAPAQADAAARVQTFLDPGSKVEASVCPQPPDTETDTVVPESKPSTDALRRHPDSTVGMSDSGRPTLGVRIPAAECTLLLQSPGVRLSEPQTPPGKAPEEHLLRPAGCDLAKTEVRTEMLSLQPEGPLKLKASRTDVPAQISLVNMDQLWEDSVLTVTFPKLKVPRFSFPTPSSESDVFFPVVREVPAAEAGTDPGLLQGTPGLWGASLLRAGTADLSSEEAPVAKVRVHIEGPQGESRGVTVCSRVTGESPEAFSTRIVRESEIPASTVQTPSYGFSLLKAKMPEPHAPASAYTAAQDPGVWEHSERASTAAAPGADALPGDPQPDMGEPFEMISASANLSGLQTFTSEVHSGLQRTDSGSDEEPAEILEFPFDDSQETATPPASEDRAPKEKPEGKKSSGLLWSWLPNIGFSSINETSADSGADTQRSAPIQVQPAARPDPEPSKKQERAGWFRFPRLGFSSSPAKKSESMDDEAGLAGRKSQEETVTFFDAQESLSPEEEEGELEAGAAGAGLQTRAMVTSSARTELVLLEQSTDAGEDPAPRPVTK